MISAFLLPPIIARLRSEHPGIDITIVASNEVRDLRRREADIAIRSGRPTDPKLIATRLRDTPARLYATRSYLRRLGNPTAPGDLGEAEFIGFSDDDRFMNGLNALGFALTMKNFPIRTANHMVLWEFVKSGLGIGVIIDEVGDAEPLVERVFPSLAPIPVPTWLVSHREVHTSRRVRVVFDVIAEAMGPARSASRTLRKGKRRTKAR